MSKLRIRLAALALVVAAAGCGGENEAPGGGDAPTQAQLVAKGEQVYKNVCATCHGGDPNEDGVLGPAIADASMELLTARIVHGNYPEGYTPKRASNQMVALPHLEPVIPEIHAYLQSVRR